jgi:hypothetical protein
MPLPPFPASAGFTQARAAGSASAAVVPAIAVSATWGTAKEVRGMNSLDHGGDGEVDAVSCAAKGECSAGGYYDDAAPVGSIGQQALTVGEQGGVWGAAQSVPSLVNLNTGDAMRLKAVSCAAPGNCGGTGYYADSGGTDHSFVVAESGGTWTGAIEVPGDMPVAGKDSRSLAESCPAVGRCTIGGFLHDSAGNLVAYVDSQTPNHAWGTALPVPGLPTTGFESEVWTISCRSPGNCVAGGFIDNTTGTRVVQAFVVSETNGLWHQAREVAAAKNKAGEGFVQQVSCGSPGNCVAVGYYSPAAGSFTAFIEAEKNGAWQPYIALSGLGTYAGLLAVSCASAGNCTAGGQYRTAAATYEPFVVTQRNGKWGKPTEVPGDRALNTGHNMWVSQVSCVSQGNCAAAGVYTINSIHGPEYTWVAGQRHGVWGSAAAVRNLNALNVGNDVEPSGLSCATLGSCGMVGYYSDAGHNRQPFVVSGAIALPTVIRLALSTGTVRSGHEQAEKISVSVTAANGRRPPGKVTVKAGSVTLCVITLTAGAGSCRLGASQLRRGSYTVAAVYDGSHDYQGSNVAKKPLRVTT